jgi:hypothetical protein
MLPAPPNAAVTIAAKAAGIATVAAGPRLVWPDFLPLNNASPRCGETASKVQKKIARLSE